MQQHSWGSRGIILAYSCLGFISSKSNVLSRLIVESFAETCRSPATKHCKHKSRVFSFWKMKGNLNTPNHPAQFTDGLFQTVTQVTFGFYDGIRC